MCAHCPCHSGEHGVCPPLCVSVSLTTYLLTQELLHRQPGLRSQNLYPEKESRSEPGPAESAMGTSSIHTARVQKTPRHAHQSSDTGRRLEPKAAQICPSTFPSSCFLREAHAVLCPPCVEEGDGMRRRGWELTPGRDGQLALGSLATIAWSQKQRGAWSPEDHQVAATIRPFPCIRGLA